jgi:glucose/mannose transport system permease protein
MSKSERPNPLFRNLNAKVASIPMILTAVVVFVGGTSGRCSIPSPIRSSCRG